MVTGVVSHLFESIKLDRSDPVPLHTQLYNALRELVLDGVLPGDQRLPSTRILAEALQVSRTTVLTVYDRLSNEGLLYSRTGAGSYVSATLKQRQLAMEKVIGGSADCSDDSPPLSQAFQAMYKRLPIRVETSSPQAFSTAIPAIDVFPMNQWSRMVSRYSRRLDLVRYIPSKGYEPLRRAIATHLRIERGLSCRPEQIYITGGAQQALYFLGEILLDPGDIVWFENPGSRVARNSFSARGAVLVPVPVDSDGLNIQSALKITAEFKLASVTPSHQQPRGAILSLSRRLELLNAADNANAWIIEDDFDGEFFYARQPLPTLFSIARNNRVIYVGTFSKSMFPSLRLGYFVIPETLVEQLDRSVGSYLPAVPLVIQAATAEFIDRGYFATHIRKAKRVYLERYQSLSYAIRQHLGDYLDLIPTETGFHALALFKKDYDERSIAELAMRSDVLVRPLSNYCIQPLAGVHGIALGFGCTTPQQITRSVIQLKKVFEQASKIRR